jgi:hypothetical protein
MSVQPAVTVNQVLKDLQELKKGIDEAKINQAKLSGREEELLKQLKKDHNLSSVKDASNQISLFATTLSKLEASIIGKYKELKEKYEW